jgi:hypothetical protein
MTADEFLYNYVYFGLGPYYFILICGVLFGIYQWNRFSAAGKGLWLIIAISLIVELTGSYLLINSLETNNPPFHLINCLHFIAYGWTFSKYVSNKKLAQGFLYGGLLLAAYSFISTFWIEGLFNYPTQAITVFNAALVLASLLTFGDMLRKPSQIALPRQGIFWFVTATLIFYASTFFSYALADFYTERGERRPEWAGNLINGMNYYLYISYTIALWFDSRQEKKRINTV